MCFLACAAQRVAPETLRRGADELRASARRQIQCAVALLHDMCLLARTAQCAAPATSARVHRSADARCGDPARAA